MGSKALPVLDLSCCQWSAVTTSSTITLRTAVAAAPCTTKTTPSPCGPRRSALVGLLGTAFPLRFGTTQALLEVTVVLQGLSHAAAAARS